MTIDIKELSKMAQELSGNPDIQELFVSQFFNKLSQEEKKDFKEQIEKLYQECLELMGEE